MEKFYIKYFHSSLHMKEWNCSHTELGILVLVKVGYFVPDAIQRRILTLNKLKKKSLNFPNRYNLCKGEE